MGGVGGTTPFLHTYHEPSGSKQPCCDRAALSEAKREGRGVARTPEPLCGRTPEPLCGPIFGPNLPTHPSVNWSTVNIGPGMVGVGWLGVKVGFGFRATV